VVINSTFPELNDEALDRIGAKLMKEGYSADLNFPVLEMFSESTLKALDAVTARGFIDERRVGIGGISHGTFVPLYMIQRHDRISAMSISSPNWSIMTYYATTPKMRGIVHGMKGVVGLADWVPRPTTDGLLNWYNKIDIAEHVNQIKTPILMQLSDEEAIYMLRLMRNMEDAGKPYDAYIFHDETHIKWQPAHLKTIMNRNLDWFRFWLQNYKDPSELKSAQYATWEQLRRLQCANSPGPNTHCDTDQGN
jgi:dipeptidyl aminopeptidase/acylaminoacyl peptidase